MPSSRQTFAKAAVKQLPRSVSTWVTWKGKTWRRLLEEGPGTLLGLVVLDRQMHGARAPVDRHVQVALAAFAIRGPQLGQVLDVDVDEAEVVFLELARRLRAGPWQGGGRRLRPAALRMRQTLSRSRWGRKWRTTKVRSSRAKPVARRSSQTMARSSSLAFQGSLWGRAERSRQLPGRACATCEWSRWSDRK